MVMVPRFQSPADAPAADAPAAGFPEEGFPAARLPSTPAMALAVGGRDFLGEVADEVADYLDAHDHIVSALAADELIARWARGDPDLLMGWLLARSHQILRDYIYAVTLSRGARRPREEQYSRFAKYAAGFENAGGAGDPEKGREFYRYHSVTEGPILVRKPLADLTARQVAQVRDRYQRAAKDNAFYARVYEAVRMRVAARGEDAIVASVYTPEQLEAMFSRERR